MTINFYDTIIIILSSSVVAALVTLILGHVFENQKYIKDKKMSVYVEFIETMDKIFPAEDIFSEKRYRDIETRVLVGISKIEKCIWKINLISQNKTLKSKAKKLLSASNKFAEYIQPLKPSTNKPSEKQLLKKIDGINALRDELIDEMNRDISRLF